MLEKAQAMASVAAMVPLLGPPQDCCLAFDAQLLSKEIQLVALAVAFRWVYQVSGLVVDGYVLFATSLQV
jgi:hypothetical protein